MYIMKKIKLNTIERNKLNETEMSFAKGGVYSTTNCGCTCRYANEGGSNEDTNGKANYVEGKHSPGMTQVTYTFPDGSFYTVWE